MKTPKEEIMFWSNLWAPEQAL